MHVKIDRRPEPLDRGDGASASAPDAAARGSTALEAEERANEDPEDSSAELVIPRSRVAESMRQRQDPLPHGQAPEHVVGQMAGELRHAPPAARGTEAPPFTRKSNQDLMPALVAAKSRNSRSSRSMKAGRPSPPPRSLASSRKVSRCSRSIRWSTPFSGCRRTYGCAPRSHSLSTRSAVESPLSTWRSHERVPCQVEERASSRRNRPVWSSGSGQCAPKADTSVPGPTAQP